MSVPRSGLVAVLFTDLVGSTELMSTLGDRGVAVGDATLEGGDVFGTPVVEAARLVAAARPGQILVTAVVRVLAGSRCAVPFTDIGPLQLKGLAAPMAVCDVAWEPVMAAAALPLPGLLAQAGRIFVGRDEELRRLLGLWKEAAAGERRLVLLGGEPGVGKTRLAAQLAGTVRESGGVVLAGRCDEDLGVPYQPFVEAFRHYVGRATDRRLGRHAGELTRLIPELAQLVAGLGEPLQSDPETERYRLFDAVADWLADVSVDAPVLLVVDDLHWAAKPTLLLLRHVLRFSGPLRLLVVATYRDSDVGWGHPLSELLADVPRLEGAERLPLIGLGVSAVAAFLEQAAGHALDEDGDDLARTVWRETEGNAFFVAEVVRHLNESGAFHQLDGRWVLAAPIEDLGIPEGVWDRRQAEGQTHQHRRCWNPGDQAPPGKSPGPSPGSGRRSASGASGGSCWRTWSGARGTPAGSCPSGHCGAWPR
jgi:hypothetical protein